MPRACHGLSTDFTVDCSDRQTDRQTHSKYHSIHAVGYCLHVGRPTTFNLKGNGFYLNAQEIHTTTETH